MIFLPVLIRGTLLANNGQTALKNAPPAFEKSQDRVSEPTFCNKNIVEKEKNQFQKMKCNITDDFCGK